MECATGISYFLLSPNFKGLPLLMLEFQQLKPDGRFWGKFWICGGCFKHHQPDSCEWVFRWVFFPYQEHCVHVAFILWMMNLVFVFLYYGLSWTVSRSPYAYESCSSSSRCKGATAQTLWDSNKCISSPKFRQLVSAISCNPIGWRRSLLCFLFARGCNEAIISMVLNPASINLRNLVYGI